MQLQTQILNTLRHINRPIQIRLSKSMGQLAISSSTLGTVNDEFQYMRQYTHHNFNSKYKNWFELDKYEQSSFIDNYIAKHRSVVHNDSIKQTIGKMYDENKDVNFMFYYLYEGIKETADESTSGDELVFKDDVYDLLIEKEN